VAQTVNPWAARNLAVLACEEGAADAAVTHYTAALAQIPGHLPLVIESGRQLLSLGRGEDWLIVADALPPSVRRVGRVRLLEGRAALETGDLDRVALLFDGTLVVDDLREGELSLSELWFEYHTRKLSRDEELPIDDALRARVRRDIPVPAFLDFRMSGEK